MDSLDNLVIAAKAGDEAAFVLLVEHEQAALRAYIASYLGPDEAIYDIAQDTFISAWQRLDTLRDNAQIRAWLRGIARTTTLMHLRSLSRRRRHEHAGGQVLLQARINALHQAHHQPELNDLERCLDRLAEARPDDHAIIEQRYRQGRALDDVAASLACTQGALRTRLHRIRQLLRTCLERHGKAWA